MERLAEEIGKVVKKFYVSEAFGFAFGVPIAGIYALHIGGLNVPITAFIRIVGLVTLFVVLFVALPTNILLAKPFVNLERTLKKGIVDERIFTKAFVRAHKLPFIHGLLIAIRISLGGLVCLGLFRYYYGIPVNVILTAEVTVILGAVVAGVSAFLFIERVMYRLLVLMGNFSIIRRNDRLKAYQRDRKLLGFKAVLRIVVFVIPIYFLTNVSLVLTGNTRTEVFVLFVVVNVISATIPVWMGIESLLFKIKILQKEVDVLSEGKGDLTQEFPFALYDEVDFLSNSLNDFLRWLERMVARIIKTSEMNVEQIKTVNRVFSEIISKVDKMVSLVEQAVSSGVSVRDEVSENVKEIRHKVEDIEVSIMNFNVRRQEILKATEKGDRALESVRVLTKSSNDVIKVIEKLVEQSDDGKRLAEENFKSVKKVNELLKEISVINRVITGIATNTNILAMNASVEAAHAGEAGKGFAVVAQEIRKLSDITKQNVDRVENIVKSISYQMKETLEVSNQNLIAFSKITEGSREVQKKLLTVASSVSSVHDISYEIIDILKSVSETISKVSDSLKQQKDFFSGVSSQMKTILGVFEEMEVALENSRNVKNDVEGLTDNAEKELEKMITMIEKLHGEVSSFKVRDSSIRENE